MDEIAKTANYEQEFIQLLNDELSGNMASLFYFHSYVISRVCFVIVTKPVSRCDYYVLHCHKHFLVSCYFKANYKHGLQILADRTPSLMSTVFIERFF